MANITECDIIIYDKRGGEKMEDKIWEVFLVLFGVLLTTAIDIARERYKKNHRRHRMKRKS